MSSRALVNGVHICYEKVGNGKEVVLLLPGALGTARQHFNPQLENLDREKLTIVALDPRGQGKSRPPDRDYPADFLYRDADDAAALMKALGFVKYSVFGWSDGANSAAILAAQHPERVKKLLMLGGNSFNSKAEIAYMEIEKKQVSLLSTAGSNQDLSGLVGDDYERAIKLLWLNTMLSVHKPDENGEVDLFKNKLPNIIAETLIVHGKIDEFVPLFHAEYLHKHIKNSRIDIWENGTHDLHLKFPDKFNADLQEFIGC